MNREDSASFGWTATSGQVSGTGPPTPTVSSESPCSAGQIAEVYIDVRWPDGRRFDSRRKVNSKRDCWLRAVYVKRYEVPPVFCST